ncbi:MAG: hypothetical protein ABIF10_05645 [Candidatus Woesearchaeota archaeon]
MISKSALLLYYKRKEIQEKILENSIGREVAVRYNDNFGKRPDCLQYPKDVIEFAKRGATSFHVSEERWKNVQALSPMLRKDELDELRTGWDLVLDIDCKVLEYSREAAILVMGALKSQGVSSATIKFSGNKGFHIGIPYKAMPKRISGEETSRMFPEAARRVAQYIKHLIQEPLAARIMEIEKNFSAIVEKTKKTAAEITMHERDGWGSEKPRLNTEAFLDIDTILISSRHLYRSSYSLHEKSGLASIPLKNLSDFSVENAKPDKVSADIVFLDDNKAEAGEAARLFTQSFDYKPQFAVEKRQEREETVSETRIPESYFPPCMTNILAGLSDGRKRAIFVMLNFLTKAGWSYDEIEALLREWNKKNQQQLREQEIVGPIRYHKQHRKKVLPPNCSSTMYYKDIGVCKPDWLCSKIKNPVNYSMLKVRRSGQNK